MQKNDTGLLWVSDKRVQKLIEDTIAGYTPLASNARLAEAATKLNNEINGVSDYVDEEITTIADYLYALTVRTEEISQELARDRETFAAAIERIDSTIQNMNGVLASHSASLENLDDRVTALEQAQPSE